MNLRELSELIGIELTPDSSECTIFNHAITSILCRHWRDMHMFCDESIDSKKPSFIIESSIRVELTKLYFDVDAYDPNLATLGCILTALESALIDLSGVANVIIQGNRVFVSGINNKTFSLTFFEISEQYDEDHDRDTKSWLMNTTISG